MNTIFDKSTRDALILRINSLNENSRAQWGKMNVHQMVKHCTLWEEMVHYNKKYKQPLIGILLGKMFLKNELKDDSPMRKNNPTIPELIVKDANGNIESTEHHFLDVGGIVSFHPGIEAFDALQAFNVANRSIEDDSIL